MPPIVRRTRTPAWRRYLRLLGPNLEADIDDEVAFHIAERVEALRATGMREGDARAQALASVNGLAASVTLEATKRAAPWAQLGFGVSVQPIILFNPDGRTANYIIPGLIAFASTETGQLFIASPSGTSPLHGNAAYMREQPVRPPFVAPAS